MFTYAQRSLYYQNLGLAPSVAQEIEEMRANSPARDVGQRGQKNIVVDFYSKKNESRRRFESYTCEFLYGLELEVFGSCHEYYVQVDLKNIERHGRTSSSTADFMVFDQRGIRLVECKPIIHLQKLAQKKPGEWVFENGIWRRPPVEAWALDKGLKYEIWVPPRPHGIYQANLLVLYGAICGNDVDTADPVCISRMCRTLERNALTLQQALDVVPSLQGQHVIAAIIKRHVHAPIKSVPIDQPERFAIFVSERQAMEVDAKLFAELQVDVAQPEISSPLLLASFTDYEHGTRRLERVRRILAGEEQPTRRYLRLVKKVVAAEREGNSALEVCLTNHKNSGRRVSQLTAGQEAALSWSLSRYRRYAIIRTKQQAHDLLRLRCESESIRPPSRTTFNQRLRRYDREIRAYTEGGYRGLHASEVSIEPSNRTLRCLAPGLMVHVDATKFDVRCSPGLLENLGFECPTIYIAMDSATGLPLGRSVLFGPACRNALAVLIRDVYHRQGYLPRYWIADGGSEYVGSWFEAFCSLYGATRIQPPPGAPRKNSLAENALGRINAEHVHKFLGSTKPDQRGRSVTARQKSMATACHAYSTIVKLLDAYLFDDMANVPCGANRLSASEKKEELAGALGAPGITHVGCKDEFLIATSIPLERDVKVDPVRGIRHLLRTYTSDDLMMRIRTSAPIEKRIDCVDPHRMYVKFPDRWVLAMTAESIRLSGRDELTKLFDLLSDGTVRNENARIRMEKRLDRTRRFEEANAVSGSVNHLLPMLDAENNPVEKEKETPPKSSNWSNADVVISPFETEGAE